MIDSHRFHSITWSAMAAAVATVSRIPRIWIANMGTQIILGSPGGLGPGLKAMSAPSGRASTRFSY